MVGMGDGARCLNCVWGVFLQITGQTQGERMLTAKCHVLCCIMLCVFMTPTVPKVLRNLYKARAVLEHPYLFIVAAGILGKAADVTVAALGVAAAAG